MPGFLSRIAAFLFNISPQVEIDEEPTRSFFAKVVGVSFPNNDGSSRQNNLKRCYIGEALELIHCPMDDYPEAVEVWSLDGRQLGNLSSEVADEIAPLLDDGIRVDCTISDLTGGTRGKPTRGCNIEIAIWDE